MSANSQWQAVAPVFGALGANINCAAGDIFRLSSANQDMTLQDPYGPSGATYVPAGTTGYIQASTAAFNGIRLLYFALGTPFVGNFDKFTLGANQTIGVGSYVTIASTDPVNDNTVQVKVIWRDTAERRVTTATLPITLSPNDTTGTFEIEAVFKPVTKGSVQVLINNPAGPYLVTTVAGTLGPTDLVSPRYQRVRVFSIPTAATALMVLGKKPFVPLDFGSEQPALKNLDNCLLAFGLSDMLARVRQYGKAAQQMQEGLALLSELAKLETIQAANNQRFVPDGGYGDPFFAPSSNRGLWM